TRQCLETQSRTGSGRLDDVVIDQVSLVGQVRIARKTDRAALVSLQQLLDHTRFRTRGGGGLAGRFGRSGRSLCLLLLHVCTPEMMGWVTLGKGCRRSSPSATLFT